MKEQIPEPFRAEKDLSSKSLREEVPLTFGRAISNLKDAEHSVGGKAGEYLEGLRRNIEGALGFFSRRKRFVNAFLETALVAQLAQACAPRTFNAEDIIAATSAITEQYKPPAKKETKLPTIEIARTATAGLTPSATPEPTTTTEPTKSPTPMEINSDGNYVPKQEAFVDTGLGKIKEIKDLEEPNDAINKVVEQIKEKLSIKNDEDLQKAYLDIVCENGNRAYMIVKDNNTGTFYAVFAKNKDGFYLSPDSEGELALLPIKIVSEETRELIGFDVKGDLLIPPTFTFSTDTGELTYTDPKTGEQVVIKKGSNTAPKMLAMLKGENTVEKPLTAEQQKAVEKSQNYYKDIYHTDPNTIDITFNKDGQKIITDKVSGRVIAVAGRWATFNPDNTTGKDQLENGSWVFNPNLIKRLVDEGLEKNGFKPGTNGVLNWPTAEVDGYNIKTFDKFNSDNPGLLEQLVGGSLSMKSVFLNSYHNGYYSWGIIVGKKINNESWADRGDKRYLIYKNSEGVIKYLPIYYPNYLIYS